MKTALRQLALGVLLASVLVLPGQAMGADNAVAGKKKKPAPAVSADAKATRSRTLKFKALEIEGEHETPNVIIIQEWTPPRDASIQDEATDDLDRVFTGIRSLNRQFDRELDEAPDAKAITEEAEILRESKHLEEQQDKPQDRQRARKTSLR